MKSANSLLSHQETNQQFTILPGKQPTVYYFTRKTANSLPSYQEVPKKWTISKMSILQYSQTR